MNIVPRELYPQDLNVKKQVQIRQLRTIFRMSRFNQLSQKEIAQQMGVSLKTVEFHITKAIKFLRKELRDYFPLLSFWMLFP